MVVIYVSDTEFVSDTELEDSNKENQVWRSNEDMGMVQEVVSAEESRKGFTYKERIRVHFKATARIPIRLVFESSPLIPDHIFGKSYGQRQGRGTWTYGDDVQRY